MKVIIVHRKGCFFISLYQDYPEDYDDGDDDDDDEGNYLGKNNLFC